MAFNGRLSMNKIFGSIWNMIISQTVFSDNIAGTNGQLVDMARVDAGLYGSTKLYYATDVLKSSVWGNDAEAANLLALHRPKDPEIQAIEVDKQFQVAVTVDNYLSKNAFADEGAFSQFNSVALGWMRDTKRINDSTTYNAYIGTTETAVGNQTITVTFPTDEGGSTEADNRLQAQAIAEAVANILVDLKDVSRDYNDYGFMRSYNTEDLIVVWNSKWLNKIKKFDLPTMFHNEGLIDKFGEYALPAKYFGAPGSGPDVEEGVTRALEEQDLSNGKHVFAGELIPTDANYEGGKMYEEDGNIICKIMHKRSVPYLSQFETGTVFVNPKSLTENHYLTWGRNTLEYLKNYPFITLKAK